MIYIKLNDTKLPFRTFSTGINLLIDTKYGVDNTKGKLKLTQIDIESFNFNEDIEHVSLVGDNGNELILPQVMQTVDNYIDKYKDIWFDITNVYDMHRSILKFLSSELESLGVLRCFELPLSCNLTCQYCAQDKSETKILKSFDHYNNVTFIRKMFESSGDIVNESSFRHCDRYMGGETLLNWDEFVSTIDFYHSRFPTKRNAMEIYTNMAVSGSIEKLYNYINDNKSGYSFHDLWFTIDTLDHMKSRRFLNKKTVDIVMDNIEWIKKLTTLKNVQVNFNVMWLDSETTLNTCKQLHDMGFKFFKFATDDTNCSQNFKEMKFTKAQDCFNECRKYLIPQKMNHHYNLTYYFRITEFDNPVFTNKFNFKTESNVVEIYKSYNK